MNLDDRINEFLKKKAEYDKKKNNTKIMDLLQKLLDLLLKFATSYIEKRTKK